MTEKTDTSDPSYLFQHGDARSIQKYLKTSLPCTTAHLNLFFKRVQHLSSYNIVERKLDSLNTVADTCITMIERGAQPNQHMADWAAKLNLLHVYIQVIRSGDILATNAHFEAFWPNLEEPLPREDEDTILDSEDVFFGERDAVVRYGSDLLYTMLTKGKLTPDPSIWGLALRLCVYAYDQSSVDPVYLISALLEQEVQPTPEHTEQAAEMFPTAINLMVEDSGIMPSSGAIDILIETLNSDVFECLFDHGDFSCFEPRHLEMLKESAPRVDVWQFVIHKLESYFNNAHVPSTV